MSTPVFFDPTGRRRRVVNRVTTTAGLAAAVIAVLFVVSLLVAPFIPRLPTHGAQRLTRPSGSLLARKTTRIARHLAERVRTDLLREIAAGERRRAARAAREGSFSGDTIVAAFYAIWQLSGLQSFRANADRLTHVFPEWLHLDRSGGALNLRDWEPEVTPSNLEVLRIAHDHRVDVVPVLNNAEGGVFDAGRVHALLTSSTRRHAVIAALDSFLTANRMDGVNVDFENLNADDYERLPGFLEELQQGLGTRRSVSVDVEARLDTSLVRKLAEPVDFAVLMAYAFHGPASTPGPLAPIGWFDSVLARSGPVIGPGKLVVGIGNYGLDWRTDTTAVAISFERALMTARNERPDESPDKVVDFDDVYLNPTYVYADTLDRFHEVWFLDAVTARNHLVLAARARARGTALWLLGAEDPSLWPMLGRDRLHRVPAAQVLDTIPPYGIEWEGQGEILSIAATPLAGLRHTDLDQATGLVTDESYRQYPSAYLIRREGYKRGLLALTFDDGPDDRYTPEILAVLDSLHVPATFFVVGRNVERWPGIVRRIWAAGDEIGSHTFTHPNMATVGNRRATLEMNSTQRALQAAIGRSTTLYRVPYNADAEPSNAAEASPLLLASSLGYVTVGEQIDPQDWNLYRLGPQGEPIRRGTADLVASILRQTRTVQGNVILLHSAGGDRSRTVEAVRTVVPLLQRDGYRFVLVSELLGTTREAVMPPLTPRDQVMVGFDRVTFNAADTIERLLAAGFLLALALAILRAALIVSLAIAAYRHERRRAWDPSYRPSAAVLIAAYNERPVIVRTIASVLASDYPDLSVVVVDDGSTDGTGEAVHAAFGADQRVRLMCQPNAGKAAALNRALAATDAEIIVCFDADTAVAPDAIGKLVRHFADPAMAAAAGNIKVGNRVNAITTWQSIEYITSQNLDRRAYRYLNAVTVVPGAVGAWRRAAVLAVGGYSPDTLAEDMDLTWRLRRAGWRLAVETEARAYTEAPQTVRQFMRQRQRWTFGSLQVLWKHRGVLFHHGWFGWLVVPTVWLFQVLFQFLGPLVDIRLLYTLGAFLWSAFTSAALHADWQPLPILTRQLAETGFYYAVFFVVELTAAVVAFRLDRERKGELWWLFWQRFVYRQTLYIALWQAMISAVKGKKRGWGKLERSGRVRLREEAAAVRRKRQKSLPVPRP